MVGLGFGLDPDHVKIQNLSKINKVSYYLLTKVKKYPYIFCMRIILTFLSREKMDEFYLVEIRSQVPDQGSFSRVGYGSGFSLQIIKASRIVFLYYYNRY